MSTKNKETPSRAQSIASSSLLTEDSSYESVDLNKLYEAVLKLLILEYRNEARFRKPIIASNASNSPHSSSSSASSSLSTGYSKYYRNSRTLDEATEPKLPSYLLASLENHLNLIAMKKKGTDIDSMTRRSLLRLYSELLDPKFKADVARVNKSEYLVMKFVSCANKELVKLGTIPSHDISNGVFKQADTFVQILINLIRKDKDSDLIIAKLQEDKESLKPNSRSSSNTSPSVTNNDSSSVTYLQPSFRVTDMDQTTINLIMNLFSVDSIKLQQDVFKLKDLAQEKALNKDVQQVLFYLEKDLGQFTLNSFTTPVAYQDWKVREKSFCEQLISKYQIPSSMKLLSIPPLPSGDDFYVFPTSSHTRPFFITLCKLCLQLEEEKKGKEKESNSHLDANKPLFCKQSLNLLTLCAKFWRIDFPGRAVALYTAAHLSGILKDKLYRQENYKELGPIDVDVTASLLHLCKRLVEDGKLHWDDKLYWSIKDQEEWIKNLSYSYNEVLFSIKNSLLIIFNKSVKPKFGPYLVFLCDYIESDSLFPKVEQFGLTKKWEKKLSKALLRVSETRYAELLSNLPRDDTLSILHILEISDSIVGDIKMLQKRYKNPLLGFLNVPRTVAAVTTAMFAADAKNILKHIDTYFKNKGEFLPYGDSLEAYKSLHEIRDLHNQVSSKGSVFKFNLENFFYPFLESWVSESGVKILAIVKESIKKDTYEPLDIENDERKYSSSVLDIFTLIKEFLKILKDLYWSNELQLAKVYTALLKSISDGALLYANTITDKIIKELDEEEQKSLLLKAEKGKIDQRRSGNWLDEVKNVVSNIQNLNKLQIEEPYNFKPETCIALNNLSAMMQQLTKLEDILDPEMISNSIAINDPRSKDKYTSHIFSLRLVKAENLKSASSSGSDSDIRPYITLIDTKARKTICKTRTINNTNNPEWDEEFEITLPPNSSLTISATVWDEKIGTHSICGRALIQLDPRRFKHDGIPQEIYLDLDSQGRALIEVAVESERVDAIFVMGRAYRTLKRSQERCIKLIVEKFSVFIHYCFSRSNLRSICGNNGQLKPTQEQMDNAMMPLYDYLNMNLSVLADFLTKDLLLKVMLATWSVIISSADELLLPKISSAKTFHLSSVGSKLANNSNNFGWQSAVTSAVANVTNSMGITDFGKSLTNNELETVFSWLHFLCFDFFHNGGNGPPIEELKNEQYQALLLIPVYYDRDVDFLTQEVERLSPAFIKAVRDRNNYDFEDLSSVTEKSISNPRTLSRAGSIVRNKTISANATVKARAKAAKDAQNARADPITAQTAAEDIILRLLIIKSEKPFVARRLEQRERLAHSIATERLARAAAEGKFSGM